MIIVGFDPGLATLGYGVIRKELKRKPEMVDYGVVLTPKDKSLPDRLIMIERGVKQIIEKFRPDEIAIEGQVEGEFIFADSDRKHYMIHYL